MHIRIYKTPTECQLWVSEAQCYELPHTVNTYEWGGYCNLSITGVWGAGRQVISLLTAGAHPQTRLAGCPMPCLLPAPQPTASCSTWAVAAGLSVCSARPDCQGLYLQHFLMCQAQVPEPRRTQARVNAERNKARRGPAVWIYSVRNDHTQLRKRFSRYARSSHLRKAGLPFFCCAIYNLCFGRGACCSSTALSH